MMHLKKIISCLLVALFLITFPMIESSAAAKSVPDVFIGNEVWYKYDRYSLFEKDGVLYIPSSLFASIDGCFIEYVPEQFAMMISGNERFVSFDFLSDSAWDTDGNKSTVKCYFEENDWYVPAEYTCESLNIAFETYLDGDTVAFRILNLTDNINFEELMQIYAGEDVLPTSDPDLAVHGKHKLKRIYVNFYLELDGELDSLLELLKDKKVVATFFVSYEDASENGDALSKIAAYGHEIGIDVSKTPSDKIDEAAADIFGSLKKKCRLIGSGRSKSNANAIGYTQVASGHDLEDEAAVLNEQMLKQYIKTLYYDTVNVFSIYSYEAAEKYVPVLADNKSLNAEFLSMPAVNIYK